jgi:hypothetical protein
MERVRGSTKVGQKSWQVLSVALAFSCLESFRDFSPLKRVILLGDWVRVARKMKQKGLILNNNALLSKSQAFEEREVEVASLKPFFEDYNLVPVFEKLQELPPACLCGYP